MIRLENSIRYPKIKNIKNMGLPNICNLQTFFMTVPKHGEKHFSRFMKPSTF